MKRLLLNNSTHTFLSTYTVVALLGFQSQAVIYGHYELTWATSFAIAFAQYIMIKRAAADGWMAAFWMGLGGAMGITTAMIAFRSIFEVSL